MHPMVYPSDYSARMMAIEKYKEFEESQINEIKESRERYLSGLEKITQEFTIDEDVRLSFSYPMPPYASPTIDMDFILDILTIPWVKEACLNKGISVDNPLEQEFDLIVATIKELFKEEK